MKLTREIANHILNSQKRAVPIRIGATSLYHIGMAVNARPRILCGIAMRGPMYADYHRGPSRLCDRCWKTFTRATKPEPARLL